MRLIAAKYGIVMFVCTCVYIYAAYLLLFYIHLQGAMYTIRQWFAGYKVLRPGCDPLFL